MKINCNYSKGCTICKHKTYCTLLEPTNKNHTKLLQEIQYWLNQLQETKTKIKKYEETYQDIHNHKYSTPINVYGNIQYAPKQNAFGVIIRRPEHIYYGWNYSKLTNKKDKIVKHIKLLNHKELNMRRILKKR